jgi:hypothetical protein
VADVHGFAARAQVNGHLVGAGGSTTLRADRTGTVHVAYRVPRASGHYRLALVGAPPGPKSRPTYPPASHGEPAALVMIVPRLAILDFTVSPAGGGGSGTDAASGNRLPPAGAQAGRTADTGADVETPLLVAALCLLLGVAALTVGIGPVCSPSSRTVTLMSQPIEDERAARLDEVLAETQRQERAETGEDIERQRQSDEGIIEALAKDTTDG